MASYTFKYIRSFFRRVSSKSELKRIIKIFHKEMEKGLRGEKSTLAMIPTYSIPATGREKGGFIVADMGGTNLRARKVELKGGGKIKAGNIKEKSLGVKETKGAAEDLFGTIARFIDSLVSKKDAYAPISFVFSYPVKQTAINRGVLKKWTKGIVTKGVTGNEIVGLLKNALNKIGLNNAEIVSLANDTPAALQAGRYIDSNCDVGVILGTGTNAAYIEDVKNVKKWKAPKKIKKIIINIEWGNFNKLDMGQWDKKLDNLSSNRGKQVLEKMISGMYLGEIAKIILQGIKNGWNLSGFNAKDHMTLIAKDKTMNLRYVEMVLEKFGINNTTIKDRQIVKEIVGLVAERAARFGAAAITAVITKTDPSLKRKHTISVDGAVYRNYPDFSAIIDDTIEELFGKKGKRQIKVITTKDSTSIGAAVIGAVACLIK